MYFCAIRKSVRRLRELTGQMDSNRLKKSAERHKAKIAKSSGNESGKAFAGPVFERVNDRLRVFGLKKQIFFSKKLLT